MPTVTLVPGRDRGVMLRTALDNLPDPPSVATAQQIVVKPNVVSTNHPLAATHVEALRAVLLWLRDRGAQRVILAEGSATEATFDGFAAYNYFSLGHLPGLRIDFVDLNQDEGLPITLYDRQLRPQTVHLARTIVESDLRISVTRPKTHDAVIVTGALKNMLMGSPVNRVAGGPRWRTRLLQTALGVLPPSLRSIQALDRLRPGLVRRLYPSDKAAVHQGVSVINLNLYLLAQAVRPHLGVLDGLIGMQGNGPIFGEPVHLGWAAASRDSVALDAVMAHLLGHDPARVGYLHYCHRAGLGTADLSSIDVRGPVLTTLQQICRPSSTHLSQIGWADPGVERLFQTLSGATTPTA